MIMWMVAKFPSPDFGNSDIPTERHGKLIKGMPPDASSRFLKDLYERERKGQTQGDFDGIKFYEAAQRRGLRQY